MEHFSFILKYQNGSVIANSFYVRHVTTVLGLANHHTLACLHSVLSGLVENESASDLAC